MGEKYYVEWAMGCTIIRAENAEAAERIAKRLFGAVNGPYNARPAKVDDVLWVESATTQGDEQCQYQRS